MEIIRFALNNYRSICQFSEVSFSNYSVLIGKNNQGKSNILRALKLCMELINNNGDRRIRPRFGYVGFDFDTDFPKQKDIKKALTKFEISFHLSDEERAAFKKDIGIYNNGSLDIQIEIKKNSGEKQSSIPNYSFRIVGKRGSGSLSYNKKISSILDFVSRHFSYVYIPTIRTEEDTLDIISELIYSNIMNTRKSEGYTKLLNDIYDMELAAANEYKSTIKTALAKFMPNINDVSLELQSIGRFGAGRSGVSLLINDNVLSGIETKGSGVISLASIALLQANNNSNCLLAIEEPESHLHADAIHEVHKQLTEASKNKQIIISTHNPYFVSNCKINSIFIVSNGKCFNPKTIRDVRKELGLSNKDSLFLADNNIFVEGESDKKILLRLIKKYSPVLFSSINSNGVDIYPAGGASKVIPLVWISSQMYSRYFAIFDNDGEGKHTYDEIKKKYGDENLYLLPKLGNRTESDIEDYLPSSIICAALKDFCSRIRINEEGFAKTNLKFNNLVKTQCEKVGKNITEAELKDLKNEIAEKISNLTNEELQLSDEAEINIKALLHTIEKNFGLSE